MKFISLATENFRQFYNKQELKFAHEDRDKNITIIHGFNGSGKTALLNCFVWCLYGQTTQDLESPDRLANERALSEVATGQDITVSVRLRFSDEGEDFIVERSRVVIKKGANEFTYTPEKLDFWKIRSNGELEKATQHPQEKIHKLLPPELYPFFFFNGERLEHLAKADAYEEVEGGIKTLLDVAIYERSVVHLRGAVSSALTKELKEYTTSGEDQDLLDKETHLLGELEQANDDKKLKEKNLAATIDLIEKIEQEQAGLEKIKALVDERRIKKEALDICEKRLEEVAGDLARGFSENGYLAFGEKIFDAAHKLVAEARERGDLPAKIKPQFVDDLIDSKLCICKRPLEDGSSEVEALLMWKEKTGLAALEENISQTNNAIGPLKSRREKFFDELDRLQARKAELLTERRHLKEDIGVLEAQIGDPKHGYEAEELQQKRQAQIDKKTTIRIEIRHLDEKINNIEDDLIEVRKRISELKAQNEKAALIQKQKTAVDKVASALDKIYDVLKEDVRKDLAAQIAAVWVEAAVKDYLPIITENYQLLLTKKVGGVDQPVHGASTGEKVVLALSFVGSLVKKAEKNLEKSREADGKGIIVGGEYPLVMDSPFGSLEDDYRATVAEWIPKLAQQVIVLVSKTQWRNEVESAMRDRIGREYILELHSTKKDAEREITILGKQYPYVVRTPEPFEQTNIVEVILK